MKKERILGNILLITLMVITYLFFHFTLQEPQVRAFNAGLTTIIFLLFYFLGKGILYKYLGSRKRNNLNIYKLLVVLFSLTIPLVLSYLYMKIGFNLYAGFLASLLILIGFDLKNYIDRAFEVQLYKEFEFGQDYIVLYIVLYVALAAALLVFYPMLSA